MPILSVQEEYALRKKRQEKIERDFVFKIMPKPPNPLPLRKRFNIPYTNYEKYVVWLID